MKKILLGALASLALLASCENQLPEEMFVKKVLINQNGFRTYEFDYTERSQTDTTISVAVSGTSELTKDIRVSLAVNSDTLAGYNWERFRNEESLYFKLLPDDCYDFNGEDIIIKAGDEYTDVPITFYLDRISKDESYVLPISVVSVSDYQIGEPQYSTVLINVVLSNEHSGAYTLSGTLREVAPNITFDVKMTRTMRAENKNTISFFAGNVSETNPDREKYRILAEVLADSTLVLSAAHPEFIDLRPDNPNLGKDDPKNRIIVERTMDPQNHRKQTTVTTFYLQYYFTDKTNPEDPYELRWKGAASMAKVKFLKQ